MVERPLVSIIIPSYNQGRFIRETVDSILSQQYEPLEVLVIDGASTDETVEVLKSYGTREDLRWISEPDRGVVDAVNKGLRQARGAIIGIQSSDDFYLPGAIGRAVETLQQNDASLVFADVEYVDEHSVVTGRTALPAFDLGDYMGKLSFIPQASAFFHRRALDVGLWRDDISYAADAEFYLRIAARYPVLKVDELWARYRYHGEQRDTAGIKITRDWSKVAAEWSSHVSLGRRARSGAWLVRHHYAPESQWLRRTWALYRAVAADPTLLKRKDIRQHREWVPGSYPLSRMLSRLKRLAGLSPRR